MLGVIRHDARDCPLEFPTCQLHVLAALLALQAHIHAKLVYEPAPTPARMGFLEHDLLSDPP
jgi:hypothetical protein